MATQPRPPNFPEPPADIIESLEVSLLNGRKVPKSWKPYITALAKYVVEWDIKLDAAWLSPSEQLLLVLWVRGEDIRMDVACPGLIAYENGSLGGYLKNYLNLWLWLIQDNLEKLVKDGVNVAA